MKESFVHDKKLFEIESEEVKNDKNSHINKINEIIDSQNHDTDLNDLIDTINNVRFKENKTTFNKKNLHWSFNSYEVDKFFQAKKMHSDFSVELNFELIGKEKV